MEHILLFLFCLFFSCWFCSRTNKCALRLRCVFSSYREEEEEEEEEEANGKV